MEIPYIGEVLHNKSPLPLAPVVESEKNALETKTLGDSWQLSDVIN